MTAPKVLPLVLMLSLLNATAQVEEKEPLKVLLAETKVEPGTTYDVHFPELGNTWKDEPAKVGIYFPTDYDPAKPFPLFVWFGGGAGNDRPKKTITITEGKGYICIAVPYRSEDNDQQGGWQTPWSYYETIFQRLENLIPNIDPKKRVAGGYSSGGAAVMFQLGNSDGAFQDYFHAFLPSGAGWPMGGLETIKGRPMLAIIGEKDKRLPNFQKIETEARAAGVDINFHVQKGIGHKFPPETYPVVRKWLQENVK